MKKNDKQIDLFQWADSRPSAEIIDFFETCMVPRLNSDVPFYVTQPEPAIVIQMKRKVA